LEGGRETVGLSNGGDAGEDVVRQRDREKGSTEGYEARRT